MCQHVLCTHVRTRTASPLHWDENVAMTFKLDWSSLLVFSLEDREIFFFFLYHLKFKFTHQKGTKSVIFSSRSSDGKSREASSTKHFRSFTVKLCRSILLDSNVKKPHKWLHVDLTGHYFDGVVHQTFSLVDKVKILPFKSASCKNWLPVELLLETTPDHSS